jgi:hypothetical protein
MQNRFAFVPLIFGPFSPLPTLYFFLPTPMPLDSTQYFFIRLPNSSWCNLFLCFKMEVEEVIPVVATKDKKKKRKQPVANDDPAPEESLPVEPVAPIEPPQATKKSKGSKRAKSEAAELVSEAPMEASAPAPEVPAEPIQVPSAKKTPAKKAKGTPAKASAPAEVPVPVEEEPEPAPAPVSAKKTHSTPAKGTPAKATPAKAAAVQDSEAVNGHAHEEEALVPAKGSAKKAKHASTAPSTPATPQPPSSPVADEAPQSQPKPKSLLKVRGSASSPKVTVPVTVC